MSRQAIRSVKLRKVRRRVFFLKIFFTFLGAIILLGFLLYGFNTNVFKIQSIFVEGGQPFVNDEIKNRTEEILSGSYFGLVPKRNILLYPKWQIEREILKDYSRIQEISFELDPFKEHVLNIEIVERKEYGTWCQEQECYFIDKNGYIFAPAPTYSDGIIFSYSGFVEGDPVGSQYIEENLFRKINSFVRAIEADPKLSSFKPVSLEHVVPGEFKIILSEGGYIIFNDKHALENIYENIVLSVENGDIDVSRLEYIDARISNKVFYKHNTGEAISE